MKVWRGVFAFAAVYNLAVGASMAAAPAQIASQLGIAGPGGGYSIAMVGLLIATFGVGYALVAHDPVRNRGIVWIGLLSKVAAATLAVLQFAAGAIPASTFVFGMTDVAFAVVFIGFLWRGPRAP